MCDGCGRGRNELEMTIIIFLEIVKTAAKLLLQVWTLCVAGYAKVAIVGAYHRTSDGQEHKLFSTYVSQRAESKAATVTIRFGSFTVAGDFVLQLAHSSRKSWERTGRELTTLILDPVADTFAMCTDRK